MKSKTPTPNESEIAQKMAEEVAKEITQEKADTAIEAAAPADMGPAERVAVDAMVSLIEDPFGLTQLEIEDAQESNDELDLDDDDLDEMGDDETSGFQSPMSTEDSDALLDRMAIAVDEEVKKVQDELIELAQTPEKIQEEIENAEAKLAAQIAEDQALEAEMARQDQEAAAQDPELLAALPKAPETDENGDLDLAEMQACIEALLFMCDKPLSLKKLQDLLGPDFATNVFQESLTLLMDRYKKPCYGIELVQVGGGYQFRTKQSRAALAKKLARVQTQRLSSGGMESLAIVAYKQPVMKEEIDKVRGVDSSYFIRGLLDKKLIRISGRSELPGRPMLYSTTDEFLELFGLKDLAAMPPLRELEQMVPGSQSGRPDDEDPRVKEMRKLVSQMKADGSTSLKYDPREDEVILKGIRERVGGIAISTPYLEDQVAMEKAEKLAAKEASAPETLL